MTVPEKTKLRIEYDDQPNDVVDRVNHALASVGLVFVDDGKAHEGFCVYELRKVDP